MRPIGNGGERGVTPVVGIILVVALATILAAVVGGYVFQVRDGTAQEPTPQVTWEYDYDRTTGELTIMHSAGDALDPSEIYVQKEATGEEVTWANPDASWASTSPSSATEVTTDDSFTVTFSGDEATDGITIYWRTTDANPENERSAVIGQWEFKG